MPGQNGTGPESKGPRTGRGLGRCRAAANETVRTENDEPVVSDIGNEGELPKSPQSPPESAPNRLRARFRNGQGGSRGGGKGGGGGRGGSGGGRHRNRGKGGGGRGRHSNPDAGDDATS